MLGAIPNVACRNSKRFNNKQPSLVIARRILPRTLLGFHRYEPQFTAQSLGRGATSDSWARYACYPRGSFCPFSASLSFQGWRITKPDFRPVAGNLYLHRCFSFAESMLETAAKSLRHSCGSELARQGISLP